MQLYFLGTGAGMPSTERNVSSLALQLLGERGSVWMFDCGEGTQHVILKSPIKLSKLEMVFITHLHGDHIYGLPGLLSSRSNYGSVDPITIVGPVGIRSYLEQSFRLSDTHLRYAIQYIEWELPNLGQIIHEDDQFIVRLAPLEHRIASCGYRIEEKAKNGELLVEKLKQHGVLPGPIYAQIKSQEVVSIPGGEVLRCKDYIGPEIPGRVVAIAGDTRICEGTRYLLENADVAVHEATFTDDFAHLAADYYHSTSREVAKIANEVGCKNLILTHISARFSGETATNLLEQANEIHDLVFLAHDHFSFQIPTKKVE
jgi:ribonuclease Z